MIHGVHVALATMRHRAVYERHHLDGNVIELLEVLAQPLRGGALQEGKEDY